MIQSVFIGIDGTVGVFNEKREQVKELCGKYADVHEKLFEVLKNQPQAPGFMDQRVVKGLAVATAPRGTG